MFTSGTVVLGAGSDGARSDSVVHVDVFILGRMPISFVALNRGTELPGNERSLPIPWSVGSVPARFEDVQHINVRFEGGREGFFSEVDDWDFNYLKLEVDDPDNPVLYEKLISRRFENSGIWTSGTLPTSLDSYVVLEVVDESGDRVPTAEVFIDDTFEGLTDSDGEMAIDRSRLAPAGGIFAHEVIVRKRIHEQDYYRSRHSIDSHQNWNYRVYLTNLNIRDSGNLVPLRITDAPAGPVRTTISRDNTLMGLNLLVSVEWDLAGSDLSAIERALIRCSNFLYNATDGQFFVEYATIMDRREGWDDSDFRVFADMSYRANVPSPLGGRGAFLGQDVRGSAMKMSRRNPGSTYAHEFGHYGLALGDEYADDDASVQCTANLSSTTSLFRRFGPRTSCMMNNQFRARKICSTHPANRHAVNTPQGPVACWDTLLEKWNIDPRWNLRSPSDRGTIPSTIRISGTQIRSKAFMAPQIQRRFAPNDSDLREPIPLIVARGLNGAPGLQVKTRRFRGGDWIVQGRTNNIGVLMLVGIHDLDTVRVESEAGAFESTVISTLIVSFGVELLLVTIPG